MTAQQMALRARGMIPDAGYTDSYWRSLFYFNIYRLIVATLLLVTAAVFEDAAFGTRSLTMFLYATVVYILFSVFSVATITSHRPDFNVQLGIQVVADVVFVTLLVYSSGGVSSGLGLLLLASLAAAGIISRGRMTLFFAALATVAMLVGADLRGPAARGELRPLYPSRAAQRRLFCHRLARPYAGPLHAGKRGARRSARGGPGQHGAGQPARDPGHEGRRAGGGRARRNPADQPARGRDTRAVAEGRSRADAARLHPRVGGPPAAVARGSRVQGSIPCAPCSPTGSWGLASCR